MRRIFYLNIQCLAVLLVFLTTNAQELNCRNGSYHLPLQTLAHRKVSGDVPARLIALLDVHEGVRCHLLRPSGVEQVIMIAGMVEDRLQKFDGNGTGIGFDIYDTCSSPTTTLNHLIYALVNAQAIGPQRLTYVGVVGPINPNIQLELRQLLKSINIPYFPIVTTTLKEEIKAMVEVMADLRWKMTAVFASTKSVEAEFFAEANSHDICITVSTSLLFKNRTESFYRKIFQDISTAGTQVAVVLGTGIDLRELYNTSVRLNSSLQYWLIAGVDVDEDIFSVFFEPDHPVIHFRRAARYVPSYDANFTLKYEFGDKIKQLDLVRGYVEYMNSCRKDSSGIVINDSRCVDQIRHSNFQRSVVEESVDKLVESMTEGDDLPLENSTSQTKENSTEEISHLSDIIEIWTYQHAIGKLSEHKALQVGHYNQNVLSWDKKRLNIFRFMGSGWFKIPEFYCQQSCQKVCKNIKNISISLNPDTFFNNLYHWKHETWVNILLTISSVGIIIALLSGIFLFANSFREDFEEGSQINNVVILSAVILSYCCTAMFVLQTRSFTCYKRLAVVGIAYVSMLSPILSRCFLLISAEMDGIHAHISGLIQFVLSFFMVAVQIAMAVYFWILYPNINSYKFKCSFDSKITISYLSYSMFLSLSWLIASPFCARSRRNNKEGLLLHCGSIAVCVIWLVWFLLFFLLNPRWSEFTVCFGLIGTATSVLLVVYVPKVYKMVVAASAKQQGQLSMQPVIFASTSSRSPDMSIYESVNHGYNPDKDGFVVDVFRDEDDSPRPRKMTHL